MSRRIRAAVQCWLPFDEPSGARSRLLGLLHGLTRSTEANDFEVVLLAGDHSALPPELARLAAELPRGRVRPVPIPPGPTWRRALAERRVLPGLVRSLDLDLLDLQSLPVPALDVPAVLTVHDLRDLGPFARGWRRLAAGRVIGQGLRRARRVIVPSPPVRDELRGRFPAAPPVDVVPACAVAAAEPADPGEGLRGAFLHVGRDERRKALPFLLEVYAAASRRTRLPPLVLAGVGPAAESTLRARAQRLGIEGRVVLLARVDQSVLDGLLATATALVSPSRLEGFGLPVAEALVYGTPSLVAAGGACAWVAGDGGLALPPEVPAWAQAMIDITSDGGLRARLAAAALERAREFTPERAAEAWTRAWRSALSEDGNRQPRVATAE